MVEPVCHEMVSVGTLLRSAEVSAYCIRIIFYLYFLFFLIIFHFYFPFELFRYNSIWLSYHYLFLSPFFYATDKVILSF